MQVLKRIKEWYKGKHVDNDPNDPMVFIGFYNQHWTARIVEKAWDWLRKEYKWLIGVALALLSLFIAR